MNELDKTIDDCLKKAKEFDELAVSYREIQDNYVRILGTQYKPDYSTSIECAVSASKNKQLAEWLTKLKRYEDGINRIIDKIDEAQWCKWNEQAQGLRYALKLLGVEE